MKVFCLKNNNWETEISLFQTEEVLLIKQKMKWGKKKNKKIRIYLFLNNYFFFFFFL
jgi:hypothetical protein